MSNETQTGQYKAPRAIANHPGVEACESGDANGSDYRHDVLLREGWKFTAGRMAGCRTGLFHTVAAFKNARAVQS